MPHKPVLTVVIPTFNNRYLIELCLRSMSCFTRQPYRIIIKDNGSRDGTIEFLKTCKMIDRLQISFDNDYANVEYRTYDNIIRNFVDTQYFLVCHSDIIFLCNDWIEEIKKALSFDPDVIMGGQLLPSSCQFGRIMGRWLSPWYAWGKTQEFRELNLTWQRKHQGWCEEHMEEVKAYFDQELMSRNPKACLFWEHGGYLLYLAEQKNRKISNIKSTKIYHIGDMTGSVVKRTMLPWGHDIDHRNARVLTINKLICHILKETRDDEEAFMQGCQEIAAYSQQNDIDILQFAR